MVKKLLIVLVLIFIIPVQSVYAAMRKAQSITLDISNISKDAAYIDVLIDFENGENFIKFNQHHMKSYSFDPDELSKYNQDGFVSISCHYNGIKTDMHIKEGKTTFISQNTHRLFLNRNKIKIAVLDKSGHIIQLSDTVKLNENDIYLVGDIKYNVGENMIEPDMFDNSTNDFSVFLTYLPYIWVVPASIVILIVVIIYKKGGKMQSNNNNE